MHNYQILYGPSYISLESALAYHQWIPEIAYTTTSVCAKRSHNFKTPLGEFTYNSTPSKKFYMGVERIVESPAVFLMASPWKALADYIYVNKPSWRNAMDITMDLRIEQESFQAIEKTLLQQLSIHYPNNQVKKFLKILAKELK